MRQYLRALAYLRASDYRTGKRLVQLGMATLQQAEPGHVTDAVTGQLHLGPSREVALYRDAAAHLTSRGVEVLLLDNGAYTPSDVARRIADAIPALPLASVPSNAPSTPQGP